MHLILSILLTIIASICFAEAAGTCLYVTDNSLFEDKFENHDITETIHVEEKYNLSLASTYQKKWISIDVKENATLKLLSKEDDFFKIKSLVLNDDSVLELNAGSYFIENFIILGENVKIITKGPVKIFIKNNFDLKDTTTIETFKNNAANLLLIGLKKIKIRNLKQKMFAIVAAKDKVEFLDKAEVEGFIISKKIIGFDKVKFSAYEKALKEIGINISCWQDNSLFTATHLDLQLKPNKDVCAKDILILSAKKGKVTSIDYTGIVNLKSSSKVKWHLIEGKGKLSEDESKASYVFLEKDKGIVKFGIRTLGYDEKIKIWAEDSFEDQIRSTKKEIKNIKQVPDIHLVENYATAGKNRNLKLKVNSKCGDVELFNDTVKAKIWFDYESPKTGKFIPEVYNKPLALNVNYAETFDLKFVNSESFLDFVYDDVGKLKIHVEPTSKFNILSSSIIVKPFRLKVQIQNAGYPNNIKKAGEKFSVIVNAENAKEEIATNFGKENENIKLALELVEKNKGKLFNASNLKYEPDVGFIAQNVYFDSVGDVHLKAKLENNNYLSAGDVESESSTLVGNFVPNHFDIELNSPEFKPWCKEGNFTYFNEAFDFKIIPILTVIAKNSSGKTITEYKDWEELKDNIKLSYKYHHDKIKLKHPNVHLKLISEKNGVAKFHIENHDFKLSYKDDPIEPIYPEIEMEVVIGNTVQKKLIKHEQKMMFRGINIYNLNYKYHQVIANLEVFSFENGKFILNTMDSCTRIDKNDIITDLDVTNSPVINGVSFIKSEQSPPEGTKLQLRGFYKSRQ